MTAELQYANTIGYQNTFTNNSDDLSITIMSKHGIAWKNYFNRTLQASGLVDNTNFLITSELHPTGNSQNDYYTVTITIHNVKVFDHTRAMVTLSIGELGMV